MPISLNEIKKLREETKVGIMACRKALEEAKGDFAKAKKILEKKNALVASEKADRETKSGIISAYVHAGGEIGALVKLACESDFVSLNEDFQKLGHEIAMQVAAMNPKDVPELLKQEYIRDPSKTIDSLVKEAIGKIRENIKITAFSRLEV